MNAARLYELMREAAEAAEQGNDSHPLMQDVYPHVQAVNGARVGALVFNALKNIVAASRVDPRILKGGP